MRKRIGPIFIPYGARINVKEGDQVFAGGQITRGPLNPHDILRLNGVEGVYQYLLKEVQRVYKQQGVDINDKHVEVIVSQMLSKYKIEDAGDTDLLPGGLYGKFEIEEANAKALEEGGEPCVPKRILLGITKASLATNSFLSAASFQETTRVLTDAAIKGKNDKLLGLKENVIIGKLIPAGTGMKRYRNIELDYGVNAEIMENFERQQAEEAARAEAEERAFLEMQQAEAEAAAQEAADADDAAVEITMYDEDGEDAAEAVDATADEAAEAAAEADAADAEGHDREETLPEEE